MTDEQMRLAWKLRAQGKSYQQIADAIGRGLNRYQIRDALFPRRTRKKTRPVISRNPGKTNHRVIKSSLYNREPPPEVQREARLAEINRLNMTIGQMLFGDPLPGRSALDQRKLHLVK